MRLADWKQVSLVCGMSLWVVYLIASDAWREYARVFAGIAIFGIILIAATFIYLIYCQVRQRTLNSRNTIRVQMQNGLTKGKEQATNDDA